MNDDEGRRHRLEHLHDALGRASKAVTELLEGEMTPKKRMSVIATMNALQAEGDAMTKDIMLTKEEIEGLTNDSVF